jgi:branched-chain amino acid transport system permease protein
MGLVLINGLALGALYGMTAIIYNITFSTAKVLSFGTGHYAMLGGVFGAWFMLRWSLPLEVALPAVLAVGAVCGLITELVAVRRLIGSGDDHLWVLSTLALATMTQEAVGLWRGTDPTPFPRLLPQPFSGVADQKFWLPIGLALVMAFGLDVFYRRTLLGKAFIAVSEDSFAARARGLVPSRIRMGSFMLAGALGALSGFAAGQLTFADFSLGTALSLSGFIALALGGIGSNVGALIGGVALGLMTAFTSFFFGAEYQKTIAIGLLVLLLVARPQGLFGSPVVRPV